MKKTYAILASIAALGGNPVGMKTIAYNTSQGAVLTFTRALAGEWGVHGITVNAICPGTVATAMVKNTYNDADVENQLKNMLLGRLGDPEEIAAAVVYYASTESGFVTGNMHDINGGGYFG